MTVRMMFNFKGSHHSASWLCEATTNSKG